MRIAFYAPMKSPASARPSGDREIARLLLKMLELAGNEVRLISEFRSFEGVGDLDRQEALRREGHAELNRISEIIRSRWRPELWLTYHLFHKAPDWLGPEICRRFDLPYTVAEASFAPKQLNGPWHKGHLAVEDAIRSASLVICLNPHDEACIQPLLAKTATLVTLPPFLDSSLWQTGVHRNEKTIRRRRRAVELGIPTETTWIVTVAMMRPGDKFRSFELLGNAMNRLRSQHWALLIVGDGVARDAVEQLFSTMPDDRVRFLGQLDHKEIVSVLAEADLFVWPAFNEAIGMAILEAQAAGLPVAAGRSGAIRSIVRHGQSGLLSTVGDTETLALDIDRMVDDESLRHAMSQDAEGVVKTHHDIHSVATRLQKILKRTLGAESAP